MTNIEPSYYAIFLSWMEVNRIGDLSGVAGIVLSLIGFGFTLWGVYKSKSAAERAAEAAHEARESIRLLDAVVEFSTVIAALEEIKRLQREGHWTILPDRYASVRRMLANLRTSKIKLEESQIKSLQDTTASLRQIEDQVERWLSNPAKLNAPRFNRVIGDNIENLLSVLNDLKIKNIGA